VYIVTDSIKIVVLCNGGGVGTLNDYQNSLTYHDDNVFSYWMQGTEFCVQDFSQQLLSFAILADDRLRRKFSRNGCKPRKLKEIIDSRAFGDAWS
jgi:hypothetical protein